MAYNTSSRMLQRIVRRIRMLLSKTSVIVAGSAALALLLGALSVGATRWITNDPQAKTPTSGPNAADHTATPSDPQAKQPRQTTVDTDTPAPISIPDAPTDHASTLPELTSLQIPPTRPLKISLEANGQQAEASVSLPHDASITINVPQPIPPLLGILNNIVPAIPDTHVHPDVHLPLPLLKHERH